MKVAHVCYAFSALSETFIYDAVCEMDAQGVDCHVYTLIHENQQTRPFDRVTRLRIPGRWHPLRVYYKLRDALIGHRDEFYANPLYRAELLARLEQCSPDYIHAHFGTMGVLAGPVASQLGIPLAVTFYGFDASRLSRDPRWVKEYESLWQQASIISVLSTEMQSRLEVMGCPAEKIHVVHLGKNLEHYRFRARSAPLRRFVSVGRLSGKKGHEVAVEAFSRLARSVPDIRLDIIGEGPDADLLGSLIDRHGLQDTVFMTGSLGHDEVIDRLDGADAFLLLSRTAADGDEEGTPTVLMESQAMGLPTVSTRHAGIPEVLPRDNHFLLAEQDDVDSAVQAIEQLLALDNEALDRLARRGREKVENDFDISRETRKLLELYAGSRERAS